MECNNELMEEYCKQDVEITLELAERIAVEREQNLNRARTRRKVISSLVCLVLYIVVPVWAIFFNTRTAVLILLITMVAYVLVPSETNNINRR